MNILIKEAFITMKTKLKERSLKITKMSVSYVWEPRINKQLSEYGLEYTSVVCIQTLIPWYEYNVYLSVKHIPGKGRKLVADIVKDFKIVKLYVKFDETLKKIETFLHILARENKNKQYDCITNISDGLILDNRNHHIDILISPN